ncbi:MAG: imelysin family protein [Pseudomonadota bacterium]
MRLAALACLLAAPALTPAWADVVSVLDAHILPGHARLAAQTEALAEAARADCAPESLLSAYHDARDAWVQIGHIQFGPLEESGLALAMDFWPDPRGTVPKTIARLTVDADIDLTDPDAFAEVSAAAQGFSALEWMLFTPQARAEEACALTRAIAGGLARKAASLEADWPAFADLMTSAGADGNTRFQSELEAQRALYTALSTGLEFLHDQRLGRPLGTFDRPRPRRAEARRSDRSLRHITLSLGALEELAVLMGGGDIPQTRAAFAEAKARAAELDDPALQGVADPAQRFRVEVLQQAVRAVQVAVIEEVGRPLGISAGFNALDGD